MAFVCDQLRFKYELHRIGNLVIVGKLVLCKLTTVERIIEVIAPLVLTYDLKSWLIVIAFFNNRDDPDLGFEEIGEEQLNLGHFLVKSILSSRSQCHREINWDPNILSSKMD